GASVVWGWGGARSADHPAPGLLEPADDRPVDDLVADLDADATDDAGVDDDVGVDGPAVVGPQRADEPLVLVLGQRHRGGDDRGQLLLTPGRDLEETLDRAVVAPGARRADREQ